MRYKDLNHQAKSTRSTSKIWFLKAGLGIISLVIIFFGLKLLISPVATAIAGFLRDSTTSISFFIGRSHIKQDAGISNVLLLGVDERGQGSPSLTDTIILASFRHEDQKIVMISIPRDLWIRVPEFEGVAEHFTKINGTYSLGEEFHYPEGGIKLLSEVISNHFGLPIHYFAKVNFNGFEEAINAVDGIDIYVEQAFVDYQYPRTGFENASWSERWEIVSFKQGWQHMTGETALEFARSRHAFGPEGSDFARAKRQQKVLLALQDKIISSETLFNLNRLKELYLTLSNEIETNIGLSEIPIFYESFKGVADFTNIDTYVLTTDEDVGGLLYVPDLEQFGGAFVLLPREGWESVRGFVKGAVYGDD